MCSILHPAIFALAFCFIRLCEMHQCFTDSFGHTLERIKGAKTSSAAFALHLFLQQTLLLHFTWFFFFCCYIVPVVVS